MLSLQGPAYAADQGKSAEAFIQELADNAITSLTDETISRPERTEVFRKLFKSKFAYRYIGKFVLGRSWRKANKEQQTEYLDLFQDLMVVSYVDRFVKYTGSGLGVTGSRVDSETTTSVYSEITREGATKPVKITWRVASRNDISKIIDVVIAGTSMSSTLRSDFGSIIRQRGGKVDGLLEELRIKTAALNKEISN